MLDAIVEIANFTNGVALQKFTEDQLLRYAVLFVLVKLGEAASHVSPDVRDRYPQVPWREIIGQRNFIAHGYFAIEWIDIWETATLDVPQLEVHIRLILEREFGVTKEE